MGILKENLNNSVENIKKTANGNSSGYIKKRKFLVVVMRKFSFSI